MLSPDFSGHDGRLLSAGRVAEEVAAMVNSPDTRFSEPPARPYTVGLVICSCDLS